MKNPTLVLTCVVILFSIWKLMGYHFFFVLLHWIHNISFFFWKKSTEFWETIRKLFATFGPTFSFQIPQVHQLPRIPILISIKWLLLLVGCNIFTIVLLRVKMWLLWLFLFGKMVWKICNHKISVFLIFWKYSPSFKFSPKKSFIWTLI